MSFESVWLATDLGDGALVPYVHALRVGAGAGCPVTLLHVQGASGTTNWDALPTPDVLETHWSLSMPEVDHHILHSASTTAMLAPLVERDGPALLVLGTHRRAGLQRWMKGSVAETVARRSLHALVVPDGVRPFVEPDSGRVRLAKVVVPVGYSRAQNGVDAAVALLDALDASAELVLVYVGEVFPALELPTGHRVRKVQVTGGEVVGRVLEVVTRENADLIVMATDGHDSLADDLWGSRTERVIRETPVPVLSVRG